MLSSICVKSFITIDGETTDPQGIEILITTRTIRRKTTFVDLALGDPSPGLKSMY